MSTNKKLGGIRLRLIVGLMAVLAIFGVVLALGTPRPLTPAAFFTGNVNGGDMAELVLEDLAAGTYYIFPRNRESLGDLVGWVGNDDNDQDGLGTDISPAIFEIGTTEHVWVLTLTEPIDELSVFILTEETAEEEMDTSVEVRQGAVNGTLVGGSAANITVLTQIK